MGNETKEFCEKHPDVHLMINHVKREIFCPRCRGDVERAKEIKKADDIIEETVEEDANRQDEKPQLNASRVHQFGTYRLFYDIKIVDEKQKIWRGRPVPEADHAKIPQARDMEKSWVLFTREYSNENDWDKVYPEYEIEDASMFGQRILIVPKEKILFSYNPPPGSGILIPGPGTIGRG